MLQGSESLRGFLRFVGSRAIDDADIQFKEYTIATEVFGREGTYDPRTDSGVRVQAGRLRGKLQEYYAKEGREDRVIVDLPKGHYTPVFTYVGDAHEAAATHAVDDARSKIPTRFANALKWVLVLLAAILVLILGFLALSYRSELRRLRELSSSPNGTEAAEAAGLRSLWNDFCRSPEPVLITFSNTLFQGTAESGMKLLKPLDSPLTRNALAPGENPPVVTEHYTGVGEVMGVYFLCNLFSKLGQSFRVKRSLLLNWDDLKTENLIFLGSPAENFLLRELPQEQEFVFRMVKQGVPKEIFGIVNLKPRAGEQNHYLAKQEGPSRSQISEDFALISVLRGLDAKRRLMILAGLTTFGTQAAAEYVTKPEYIKDLLARLSASRSENPSALPSSYQVLLRVKVNGGVPVQTSYVTHHVLN